MKEFLKRGLISAWGGPVVLAIIYLCIGQDEISLTQAAKGILSITALAFVAGGITAVYQMERLPLFPALLIHGAVLYGAYLSVYLLNGWLASGATPLIVFSVCFIVGYAVIWAFIYCFTKRKTNKLNRCLQQE